MPLFSLIAVLVVIGIILWAVNTYIPMDAKVKQILNIAVIIGIVIWLLRVFGIFDSGNIQVG